MSFSESEINEFRAEALELLENAERHLISLDKGGDFKTAFDAVFRTFHNLKGAAGMMELSELQSHTHALEDVLMQFKESDTIPKEYVSWFLNGCDAARAILDNQKVDFDYTLGTAKLQITEAITEKPADAQSSGLPESVIAEFLAEAEENVERISEFLQKLESEPQTKDHIESLYRDMHSLKGSALLFSYQTMGEVAHAMETSFEKIREGTHSPSKDLFNCLFECVSFLEAEILRIKNKQPETQNDLAKKLIQQLLTIAETLDENTKNTSQETLPQTTVKNEIKMEDFKAKKTEQVPAPQDANNANRDDGNSSIRVPIALLDNLMTLMGEMVLVRNQVIQFSSQTENLEFSNLSKRLNVVTNEMQGEMMKTRMQPIGNILTKYNRVVRDLSNDLRKDISLHLFGVETELDKSLLEAIKDPLTHVVRNSCDHGIELPEERTRNNKSKTGSITIKAYHEGGQVVIEVSDDGKGLHKENLIKKAIEKGIITQGQASQMSEKEVFNLIFMPGFSTAASITNVSGRGVGMDVVRTNVEKIGGSVELSSVAGKGTTTKIKIPLTLAIIPALIVRCGGASFAIPQVKLEELVRVDQSTQESKIEYLHGMPVYRLRGNILPLVNLNQVLGLPFDQNKAQASNIAVLNAEQCSFGLIIDEVQDTADIVVKPINRLLKSLQIYSGATILGDGSIALILDVPGIAKVAQIGMDKERSNDQMKSGSSLERNNEKQEFLLINVGSSTKHAIALGYVYRLEEFKKANIEYSGSQRLIRYGSSILPILGVEQELGYTEQAQNNSETINVVVIKKAGALYGLEVREIIDTLSTDVDATTSIVKQKGIFGNLNTAEELIVIVDPFELISNAFPSSQVDAVHSASTSKLKSVSSKKHLSILLAEDTTFFRKTVAGILTSAGHSVTVALDGQEAFELLEKSPTHFDLIISDIEMPRMNGFDFAKNVKGNKMLSVIPMVALSSNADQTYIDKGMASGFDAYLEKLKPNLLLNTIEEVMSAERKAA